MDTTRRREVGVGAIQSRREGETESQKEEEDDEDDEDDDDDDDDDEIQDGWWWGRQSRAMLEGTKGRRKRVASGRSRVR
ncbi:hypothetical protein K0M31_020312 [Melipona bicolor]|uniref:Uncharacterized protein n=1 Tax=Melipona bicolor TaxID=60889 RepID=A0AA40G1W9_9HYME|nr:hypothetical protein K0M31_020312 [Melipona bicolor]